MSRVENYRVKLYESLLQSAGEQVETGLPSPLFAAFRSNAKGAAMNGAGPK